MATFTITNIRINDSVKEKVDKVMRKRFAEQKSKINDGVDAVVEIETSRAVRNSPVVESLGGAYPGQEGADLPAEFGLRLDEAQFVKESVTYILEHASHGEVYVPQVAKVLDVKVTLLDRARYHNLMARSSVFTTVSESKDKRKPGSYTLHWMAWLLNPLSNVVLAETLGYGITYDLNGFQKSSLSRSGRALMANTKRMNLSQYTMPWIGMPQNATSENFVDDIAKDPELEQRITYKIKKFIKDSVK